jgi:hypothetical protein
MIRVICILLSLTVSVQSHGSREDYINHGAEHVKINNFLLKILIGDVVLK